MSEQAQDQVDSGHDKAFRRWYDYDPVLIEVLDLLRSFQSDVHEQAEQFMAKIEQTVGKEALDAFYAVNRPPATGNRWYDADPVIQKAVELLRVIPPDAQRKAALHFLEALKKQGLTKDILKSAE
jgi:hypothetical protein